MRNFRKGREVKFIELNHSDKGRRKKSGKEKSRKERKRKTNQN